MSKVKKCAACRTERPFSEMQTCMHVQMHYYVCDSKCMHAFYNQPKKPSYSELERDFDALRAENERLASKTAVTMGVGSGDGQLFVHGDHASIKAAQAIILERDQLRAELAALKAVPDGVTVVGYLNTASGEVVKYGPTLMDWDDEKEPVESLMTVTQYNALVTALRQPVDDAWVVIGPDGEWSELQRTEKDALDVAREMDMELHALHAGPAHRVMPVFLGALPDTHPVADEREALGRFVDWAAEVLNKEQGRLSDEGYLMDSSDCITVLRESALSAPAAGLVPVAYLDLGIGGYMDLGTNLTEEQLGALPWGRHMLAIIGTHGADGYTPAAGQDVSALELSMAKLADSYAEQAAGPCPGWVMADMVAKAIREVLAAHKAGGVA